MAKSPSIVKVLTAADTTAVFRSPILRCEVMLFLNLDRFIDSDKRNGLFSQILSTTNQLAGDPLEHDFVGLLYQESRLRVHSIFRR